MSVADRATRPRKSPVGPGTLERGAHQLFVEGGSAGGGLKGDARPRCSSLVSAVGRRAEQLGVEGGIVECRARIRADARDTPGGQARPHQHTTTPIKAFGRRLSPGARPPGHPRGLTARRPLEDAVRGAEPLELLVQGGPTPTRGGEQLDGPDARRAIGRREGSRAAAPAQHHQRPRHMSVHKRWTPDARDWGHCATHLSGPACYAPTPRRSKTPPPRRPRATAERWARGRPCPCRRGGRSPVPAPRCRSTPCR